MKSRYLLVLGLVAIFCLCGSAFATDYYVATNGDDGWPGTEAQPWATLDYAVDQIAPGDTILVKSGTYAGCRIENSGLSGAVCTLKADAGATVIIDAPGATCRHDSLIEVEWYDNTVRYWVIEGFEVANSPHHGIDLRGTEYITVRNCYVHDTSPGTGIFLSFSYYPTIEYNETCYNAEHGMYQSNSGDYQVMRGNNIHHNSGCGIHMNGDRRAKPGDGLITGGLIEDNVIWENGTAGGSAINGDGACYTMIRNNLLYGNHAGGIALFKTDAAAGASYNEIYNNTIVFGAEGRDVINIPSSKDAGVGNIIYNNILYTDDVAEASVMVYGPEALADSDYNVVMDRMSIDAKSLITLAEWQTYGFDAHSFISTPSALFVNPASNDYHLKVGSPAIDAGTTVAAVTDDIEGTSRPQGGAYDIGCYEAASGPVPPVANFSGNPTQGPPPLTVYFTDLSSGSPTSWSWDFGDTGSSGAQHPSHEYTAENLYTVSLTAYNAQGQDTETKVDYIDVSTGPVQSCHVGAIDMADGGNPSYKADATITVHDQDCQPLVGVTVDITWTGAAPGSGSDVTDENGQVTFTSDRNKDGGTFTCCVDSLTKAGYPYNSGANHETCDSITLP